MAEKGTQKWKENCAKSNLTQEDAQQIRNEYGEKHTTPTQQELADKYNVSQVMISYIVNNKLWADDD